VSAGYLLDTSVISMLAQGREAHLSAGVSDWLLAQSHQLFIPSIAIAELTQGIAKLRRAGAIERANGLNQWLERLLAGYGDRILPLDANAAVVAGQLSDAAIAIGRHPGFSDVAIAAIAQRANLVILTRNLKHFEPLGVACVDPFDQIPH
jgi:toxin FitB